MAGATETRERLLTGYSGRVMLLIVFGTAAAFAGRNVFGPILLSVRTDLGITSAQAGFALTVMWVAIAVMQYPGGRMSDQLSYKTVLVAGMSLLAIGFAVLTATASYPMFVAGLIVMGLGGGMFTPSSYAQLASLFEARRGQAFGIYAAAIDIGGALSGAIAIGALAVASWRMSFVPVVAALALVVVAMHLLHRGSYSLEVGEVRLEVRDTVKQLLGDRFVAPVIAGYVLHIVVYQGVLGFLPTFLESAKSFSQTNASNAFIAFFLIAAVTRVGSGYLGDRFRHLAVGTVAALIATVGLLVLVVSGSRPVTAGGLVLLAVGMTGYMPVVNASLMDRFPDTSMGGDYGAARSVFILLGSVGPTYIGVLGTRFDFETAFLALAPLTVLNALVVGFVLWRY
jgi:MFS family permease